MLTSVNDGKILAERFGGEPVDVVALHGWDRTGVDFSPVLEGLNALAIHLPGFGPAPPPETPWSTSDYAAWLAEGLDPSHPPIIVGHSFGGRIAIRLAIAHPQLVSGLVLTGVPFGKKDGAKKTNWQLRAAKALKSYGLVSERRLDVLRDRHGSSDYRASTGVMRQVLVKAVNESYFDDLPRLSQPTELVWGAEDVPAPRHLAERAEGLLPNSHLSVIAGSGHLLDPPLHRGLRVAIETLMAERLGAE